MPAFHCLLLALCLTLTLTACRKPAGAPSSSPTIQALGDAVARVGTATLSREQLEAELKRRGPSVGAQEVVEEWIRFQATLAKAQAAGYDRDPRLQAQWERWVVSQFQEETLARRRESVAAATEAELRGYYQDHADEFVVPEAVRAAVLQVRASPKATAEKGREAAARAAALRHQAATLDAVGFAELVRQHSDDQATRYRGGDIGWLTNGMVVAHWDPPVLEATWRLEQVGDLSPVVLTEKGFHIIRLSERRPRTLRCFEEVQDRLRHQLHQERLREQQQAFVREMRSGLGIQVNRRLIDSLPSPTTANEKTVPALPGG